MAWKDSIHYQKMQEQKEAREQAFKLASTPQKNIVFDGYLKGSKLSQDSNGFFLQDGSSRLYMNRHTIMSVEYSHDSHYDYVNGGDLYMIHIKPKSGSTIIIPLDRTTANIVYQEATGRYSSTLISVPSRPSFRSYSY